MDTGIQGKKIYTIVLEVEWQHTGGDSVFDKVSVK